MNELTTALGGAGDYVTGAYPSSPDYRDYRYANLVPQLTAEQIPFEVDYRSNLPPVWNQGSYGTCVAAASCWGLKAFQETVQGDFPASGLSVAYLYAKCKQMDGIPDQTGTYPRVALKVLRDFGVCTEEQLPYSWLTSDKNVPALPSNLNTSAAKYKIQTYASVCNFTDKNRTGKVEELKRAIYQEGVVLAAVLVCSNFLNVKPPDYAIPLPGGRILGGHAVALVGYSDERQAFLLRNSWGTSWGDNGYAWLPYPWVTYKTDMGWAFYEAWTALDLAAPQAAKKIELTIGNKIAVVDGLQVLMDQEPFITDKARTMIPLRFVAGNMGYIVEYRADTREIILTRPN
ncbi:MAG: hypothetical protein JRD89_04010 [Deltaproteobacteria bacterium]|nr:hypothetical protein [Deltaproteobacteria bacterium]